VKTAKKDDRNIVVSEFITYNLNQGVGAHVFRIISTLALDYNLGDRNDHLRGG